VVRSARRNRQRICALIVSRLIGPNRADTGCSAAWLARLLWEQEAGSSNLPTPTTSTGRPGITQFCSCADVSRMHQLRLSWRVDESVNHVMCHVCRWPRGGRRVTHVGSSRLFGRGQPSLNRARFTLAFRGRRRPPMRRSPYASSSRASTRCSIRVPTRSSSR
jgi:hypothetical protein